MNLYCKEDSVHVVGESGVFQKRVGLGGTDVYETRYESTGDLYRSCMKEYGRCIGKMYIDKVGLLGTPIGAQQVGWIFLKRAPENDGCIETWVTVFTEPPVRTVAYSAPKYPTFR